MCSRGVDGRDAGDVRVGGMVGEALGGVFNLTPALSGTWQNTARHTNRRNTNRAGRNG